MSIPIQLFPHKNIHFCESLIGLAGYVNQLLDTPKMMDDLYLTMNIPAQLLPHKHIRFCESLIGLAGYVRQLLDTPKTIDDLYIVMNSPNSTWLYKPTFEQLVSAVIILFAIGQVIEKNNTLQVVGHETH